MPKDWGDEIFWDFSFFFWNKFKATLSLFSTWNIANSLDQSTSNLQKLLRFGEADPE